MNRWFFGIILVSLLVMCSSIDLQQNGGSITGNPRRPKRILGGDKMRNREGIPYKVLDYYVWIGNVHSCWEDLPWWKKGLSFVSPGYGIVTYFAHYFCAEKKENLVCGGALITPRIVQTACHCLSYWVNPPPNQHWGTAKLLNRYEHRMQIYMGKTDVLSFYYPVLSEKFVIHEKCGVLNVAPKPLRYDIGWLVLDQAVPYQEGVLFGTWGKLDYAGPYYTEEIIDMYNTVVGQRHVCLVVGFGLNEKGRPSRIMRQAWIQFLDFENCYDVTYLSRGHKQYYAYNDSASWICAQQLPLVQSNNFRGRHNFGDSGGPITCSDNYVALVSSTTRYSQVRVGFTEMLSETALYHALDANSIERRVEWENRILSSSAPDELRALRLPSGLMLDHPKLKYPESRKKA